MYIIHSQFQSLRHYFNMKSYHFLFLLYLSILNISSVFSQGDSHSIKNLLSECTETVQEMNLKASPDATKMTKEDAKKMIKKMGEISKISEIPDKSERAAQWKSHPKLGRLKAEMKSLEETFKLSSEEKRKVLQSNQGMQKAVLKLSLLDPNNKKSPLKGKNIKKYLKQGGNGINSFFKKGQLKAKLIFKKLIPPSESE